MKKSRLIPMVLSLLSFTASCGKPEREQSNPTFSHHVREAQSFMDDFINTDHIIVYILEREQTFRFLEDPSAFVFDGYSVRGIQMLKRSEVEGREITNRFGGGQSIEEAYGGLVRLGGRNLPVHAEFIDFAGSVSALEKYLVDNGIEARIKRHLVISPRRPPRSNNILPTFLAVALAPRPNNPAFIWLETDIGHYFITIQEYGLSSGQDPLSPYFNFILYTYDEFIRKHGRHEDLMRPRNR